MNVHQFLEKHGLLPGGIDADAVIGNFLADMAAGLEGRESSLAMIPTYVSAHGDMPAGEPVIVIDAGGPNLRVACVVLDAGRRPRIEDFARYPMPGSAGEVSAEEFFDQLADYIRPVLGRSDRIGFCFSYPAEISPRRDGRLLKWTKELKAPGVVGRFIGQGLLNALGADAGGKRIVLLNDTIATLLAGKAAAGGAPYASYIGFILGTGTNIAYLEKNGNIQKVPGLDPSGAQAINVESGSFTGAPRGDIDTRFDRDTGAPGSHVFEKMMSGRYLPDIALRALHQGVEDGLFDASYGPWITGLDRLDHVQMECLARGESNGVFESIRLFDADRDTIQVILKTIIERAAKLAAITITAAAVKAVGEQSALPVCINIDGTTYYKAPGLREQTEAYLEQMLGGRGVAYGLVHVAQAPMIGAGIAGLVN